MKIDDMLNFMAIQGIGNDSPTDEDKTIYLKYLNVAHNELYSLITLWGSAKSTYFPVDIVNGQGVLPNDVMRIARAVDVEHKQVLDVEDIARLEEVDPLLEATGTPTCYYIQEPYIHTYPATTHTLQLRYFKFPNELTISTAETDIPYPAPYHHVLVDGALYYLLQAEGGFKAIPKIREAAIRWQTGKTALISYYGSNDAPLRVVSEDY
jgi:hypothetical protein